MGKRVKKAVLPVAGFGTRVLPGAKTTPKNLLNVVDRPILSYVVEEARAAGIEHFVFIVGRGQAAIEDYFDSVPEIEQALAAAAGEPVTLLFNPTLAPMPRGILATCTGRTKPGVTESALRDALHASYRNEPFVHVLPAGRMPTTAATAGSNCVHLQVALDARTSRATIVAAEDNLIKGAAGQAIQNANLILGLSEVMGLPVNGVAP